MMKKLLSLLMAMMMIAAFASAEEVVTEETDLSNALFMVTGMLYDDTGEVMCLEGTYMNFGVDEEGYECLINTGVDEVYALADNYTAAMPFDFEGDDENADFENKPVDDLAVWYNEVILQGLELEDESDFFSFTVKLTLNDENEITHVEYEYTPWG